MNTPDIYFFSNLQTCFIVSNPEPTLVPNELATSLAPMLKSRTNAIKNPTITIHKADGANASISSQIPNQTEFHFQVSILTNKRTRNDDDNDMR